ncbi:MAG: beta-propeller fold lactonase family protein, partial [Acidobacteriia bacterium]|nr:beta-propeller fold lactonase family protein [Terriglobia bacterium]
MLQETRTFATGGRGSGGTVDPLTSQGSLTLSEDKSLLFAVNAGSGDLSVLRVRSSSLSLIDIEPTGGAEPVAVAQHGNLVYVLNSAASSSVAGFRLRQDGSLRPINNSLRFLSGNNAIGASLAFSPDGAFLAATERATNTIDVFKV